MSIYKYRLAVPDRFSVNALFLSQYTSTVNESTDAFIPYGCPPGLEYLAAIDHLLIKQRWDIIEVIYDLDLVNHYKILNNRGEIVFNAHEESSCLARQCFEKYHAFKIHVVNASGREVMTIKRPSHFPFYPQFHERCMDQVVVEAPPGNIVGYLKEISTWKSLRYEIMDKEKNRVLIIEGPSCFVIQCSNGDFTFELKTADGVDEIGKIANQWTNLLEEFFSNSNIFGVQFPIDLDIQVKAVILGAVFPINFKYFEDDDIS